MHKLISGDILIIGGGIIGASVAYELARYKLKTVLCEAGVVLADETTSANSGVIHGGFDPHPGTWASKLNYSGNRRWVNEWFKHLGFPREQVDSLVVAYNKNEMEELKTLYERAFLNGLNSSQVRMVPRAELLAMEPNLNIEAMGALLCSISWVIDPVKATVCMLEAAKKNGLKVCTGAKIVSIKKKGKSFICLDEHKREYRAKAIINAAGHYADEIAALAGYPDFKQTTRRGEYRILSRTLGKVVSRICFMAPDTHGKGVIVAPMLNGNILIGPTALDGVPKSMTKVTTPEMYEKIGMIARHIVPSIDLSRTVMTFAGSRPIDIGSNDFVIQAARADSAFINAGGMQSPGISSAPAIALEVVKLVEKAGLPLNKRVGFKPEFNIP